MALLPHISLNRDYDASAPAAQDRVSASKIDADHATIVNWLNNTLVPTLNAFLRDDKTLHDRHVRSRMLHRELTDRIYNPNAPAPLEIARVVATTNTAITGLPGSVDNVTVADGDRILLVGQTDKSENGLWLVNSGGAWTRPADYASGSTAPALTNVKIKSGTVYIDARFQLEAAVVVDSGDATWLQMEAGIEVSDTALVRAASFSAVQSLTSVLSDIAINLRTAGAIPDPSSDAAAAMQACIDYLGYEGGTIVIPKGTWHWKSLPLIKPNMTGMLRIVCEGVIKLYDYPGCNFVGMDKEADWDVFRNISIEGVTIDASGCTTARGSALFGSVVAADAAYTYRPDKVSFDTITIKNCRSYGLPTDPTEATSQLKHIQIVTTNDADADTTCTIKNIHIENVKMSDGNGGITIAGFGGSNETAEVYLDNINVIDCAHHISQEPEQFYSCTHCHIGGFGYGGSVRVSGFRGSHSGDNGIEINSFDHAVIDDCTIDRPYVWTYFSRNYNANYNSDHQVITWSRCKTKLLPARGRGFSSGVSTGTDHGTGTINIIDCTVSIEEWPRSTGWAVYQTGPDSGECRTKRMNIRNLTVDAVLSQSLTEDYTGLAVLLFSNDGPSLVDIDTVHIHVRGSVTTNGHTFAPRCLQCGGESAKYRIVGLHINWEMTEGGFYGTYFVDDYGNKLKMLLSDLKIGSSINDANARGVYLSGSPFDDANRLRIVDYDATEFANAGTALPSSKNGISVYGYQSAANPGRGAVALTGSPMIIKNDNYWPLFYVINGGTVSAVAIAADGSDFRTVFSNSNVALPVQPGQSIKVTYSSDPTIYTIPMSNP